MQIIRFKRKSNGSYTIYLDNECSYDFYEEIILKYELLLKKNVTSDFLEQLQEENKIWDGYYIALKLINRFPKTKKELKEVLLKKGYIEEVTTFAVNKLESQGYLNDSVYAKSYVHNQLLTTYHGPNRIKRDLEQKGIDNSDCEEALLEYSDEIQREKITKIIKKKQQANHNKSNGFLKKNIYNVLIQEGFSKELIDDALGSMDFQNDDEIAKKEYDKLYKRLSKKYSGKELEYKIKQKMYILGFSNYINE